MIHEWVLPSDLSAARAARDHVAGELERLDVDREVIDDAVLMASELAANAVRHGTPPAVLRLVIREDRMRIEVHDHGHGSDPAIQEPSATAGSGRGLAIIDTLASDRGWARDATGTTVWAELAVRARPTP